MSSPSMSHFHGYRTAKTGEDIVVETCPFKPRTVKFYVDSGAGSVVVGYKTDEMAGDEYLSTGTGMDAGVTLSNKGFTIAAAADLIVDGEKVFFEVLG